MPMTRLHLFHHHPGVRSGDQLTRGERAADTMRNAMGSWPFIIAMVVLMIAWMTVNTIGWIAGWDPYPFILLNLCLSIMGGMQGAVIIIADKRGQQIAAELAAHDFAVNQEALAKITQTLETVTAQIQHLTRLSKVAQDTRAIVADLATRGPLPPHQEGPPP